MEGFLKAPLLLGWNLSILEKAKQKPDGEIARMDVPFKQVKMETSLDVCLVPGWCDSIEHVRALRQEQSDAAKIPERVCNWSWGKNGKYTKLAKTVYEICCYIYGDSLLQIVLSWWLEHKRAKEFTNNTQSTRDAATVKESVRKKGCRITLKLVCVNVIARLQKMC